MGKKRRSASTSDGAESNSVTDGAVEKKRCRQESLERDRILPSIHAQTQNQVDSSVGDAGTETPKSKKKKPKKTKKKKKKTRDAGHSSKPCQAELADRALRQEIIDTCLSMERCGINQGTSGNVSARVEKGMYITPSGVAYSSMRPEDVVFVEFRHGKYFGPYLPSSEWQMHFDLYRSRPDCQAVVHAHPTHCTSVSILRKDIPAYHYMIGAAGGKVIRCAKYGTFGTKDLSERMMHALRGGLRACLLANHGMVAYGSSLKSAFKLAVEVENLARQFVVVHSTGLPGHILSDAEMDAILSKFKTYGKQADELATMSVAEQLASDPETRNNATPIIYEESRQLCSECGKLCWTILCRRKHRVYDTVWASPACPHQQSKYVGLPLLSRHVRVVRAGLDRIRFALHKELKGVVGTPGPPS